MIDISTYLNRITSEHKVRPKFMALVEARLKPFVELFELLEEIDKAFDLDTAEGNQLDIIGQYVGVSRLLDFQPNNAEPLLPDPYYRMLLKARISLNNWDGSIEGIKKIWGDVFPEYEIQIVDNQDMTMEARIIGLETLFENELVQHGYITPKPMGVLIDYSVVFSIKLDTRLFIGNMVYNRHLEKTLPTPAPPADNSKPPGIVYAMGVNAANSVTMQTQGKPPPDKITFEEEALFLGGAKADSSVTVTLQAKPPSSGVMVGNEKFFAGGALVANSIRSTIETQIQ